MIKKVRIQLLDKNGVPQSDRLVDQYTEFLTGPKTKHDGPIKIELSLAEPSDIEKAIVYLKKLALDLPLTYKPVAKRGRPSKLSTLKEDALDKSREQIVEELKNEAKDQDDLIDILRKRGFEFIDSERLKGLMPKGYNIKKRHFEKYEWLVQLSRKAKDPRNDKYDITLLFGMSIMQKRNPKVVVYLFGEYYKSLKLLIPKKAKTQKQTNLIKYPHYMSYEERAKWGIQHRELINNPDKKLTKFYRRWLKDVIVPEELELDPKRLER